MSCALSASQPKRSKNQAKSSKYAYVAQCANSTLSVIDKLKYVQSNKNVMLKVCFAVSVKIIYI